jgi:hypothetical protein
MEGRPTLRTTQQEPIRPRLADRPARCSGSPSIIAAGLVHTYVHLSISAEFKRWTERQGAAFELARGWVFLGDWASGPANARQLNG